MYKFRIKIFLGVIALVFLGMAGRLWYLQIANGEFFRAQAETSLQTTELLAANRGTILDRNDRILAIDEGCHQFCLDYGFIMQDSHWVRSQVRAIAAELHVPKAQAEEVYRRRAENTWRLAGRLAAESGEELSQITQRISRRVEHLHEMVGMDVREQRESHPIVSGLDDAAQLALREEMAETVGASIAKSFKRTYPFDALACHIIGLTGQVSPDEQDRLNIPDDEGDRTERMLHNYLDGDVIGKSGAEKLCERQLRGRRGYQKVQRRGEVVETQAAQVGSDVHLTIDIDLQARLTELLTAKGLTGSVVVLSVQTGEVLAMVSVPMYDLNTYGRKYAEMSKDNVNFPLLHRAVARAYPPGSTIKPVTALSGLGSGVLTLQSSIECRGHLLDSDPLHFRCWLRTGHGPLDVTHALKFSCNCFFYTVGDRLGVSRIVEWFSQFGYGTLPGTGLPEESAGTLPTPATIRQRYNRPGVPADAWLSGIGQGPILATPLQVANAMATVARGGEFRSPLIADAGPPQVIRRLKLAPAHLQAVKDGMFAVVNEPGGTAFRIFNDLPILEDKICGKTGTAQAPKLTRHLQEDDGTTSDEVVREGDMAWFAGFAPYHGPKIAFVVLVEYVTTGGGGSNAGPLAHNLVQICREMGYMN